MVTARRSSVYNRIKRGAKNFSIIPPNVDGDEEEERREYTEDVNL